MVVVYFPSGARVVAEVALTPRELARGLMSRRSVPEGTGMLFDFGRVADHALWMKNVLTPLDMIFLSRGLTVVGLVERAIPLDRTLRRIGAPSWYVLEVPGGWCARHAIAVGQRAEMVTIPKVT